MSKTDELTKSIFELVKLGKIDKELAFSIIKELTKMPNPDRNNSTGAKNEIVATPVIKTSVENAPEVDTPERATKNADQEGKEFPSLAEYLDHLVSFFPYPITFSGDKVNCLNRWLVKREKIDYQKYRQIEPNIDLHSRLLDEYVFNEVITDDWQYYVAKELRSEFPDFSHNYPHTLFTDQPQHDDGIYSVCSVYCKKEKDVVFHIDGLTPIRVWINGRLTFTSSYKYHVKTRLFAFRLKKGNNTILVEKPFFVEDRQLNILFDFFSINIKPYSFIKGREYSSFINPHLLDDLKNEYTVIPDQAFYAGDEPTGFIVLPKYFDAEEPEPIRIDIINARGESLADITHLTSRKISVTLSETGVFKINVRSLLHPQKCATSYLFRGDFAVYMTGLIERGKQEPYIGPNIIYTLEELKEVPNTRTGCFNGIPELVNVSYYNLIFEQCMEFEKFLKSQQNGSIHLRQYNAVDIFGKNSLIFEKSPVDNGFLAYTIHLPEKYDPGKKYPLVLYMAYGYVFSTLPLIHFVPKQEFNKAILITLCGRGDQTFDYVQDFCILRLIDKLKEELNIAQNRVYIIGICIGAMKGFWMAIRTPHLMTALAGITGVMWVNLRNQYFGLLQNLNNLPIYQISNLDDIVYNCNGFSHAGIRLKKLKSWIFNSFTHVDLEEFFSTRKLVGAVIKEKKVNYPKKINFTVLEPFYNKSYWIEVDYIKDLNRPALVEAEIKNSSRIWIKLDNIGQLTLLLNRPEMKIGENVQVHVNNLNGVIRIEKYSKVLITIDNGALTLEAGNLTKEKFEKEYASIVPREELLGLKHVYLKKCCIIKPDNLEKKLFERRLTSALQKPFKNNNSIRNYKYDLLLESQTSPEILSQCNFIYMIDARKMNEFQQKLLENTGFLINVSGIKYKNMEYEGDYFALLSCANPFNDDRQALFIIYNSETVQEELFNFFNSFLINPLFYCQAVIYSQGKYITHRHGDDVFKHDNVFKQAPESL